MTKTTWATWTSRWPVPKARIEQITSGVGQGRIRLSIKAIEEGEG